MTRQKVIRWGILAAAVIVIAAGICSGGFKDVLTRAVMVCMECIGIG